MNKAPKKIWVWDYAAHQMVNEKPDSIDVPYIRGDLVEELVKALEGLQEWVNGTAYDKARAALKALEEE
jgi:hypothetical protein